MSVTCVIKEIVERSLLPHVHVQVTDEVFYAGMDERLTNYAHLYVLFVHPTDGPNNVIIFQKTDLNLF